MILTNGLAGSTITLTHTATGEGQFTCPNATDYDLVYPNAVIIIDDPNEVDSVDFINGCEKRFVHTFGEPE